MREMRALLASLLLFAAPASGEGQQASAARAYPVDPLSIPRPTLTALEVDAAIQIDGLLDEPEWSLARATTGTWIQITPEPGMPASELTSVRILFDAFVAADHDLCDELFLADANFFPENPLCSKNFVDEYDAAIGRHRARRDVCDPQIL